MENLLDISQLSKILCVKPMTIYGWIHDGNIPHVKLGRLVRFSEKEINEWLEKKKKAGRTEKAVQFNLN
jgi:excisionase family DNA binding protein